jgi:surfactin synthase thioesterase subunit
MPQSPFFPQSLARDTSLRLVCLPYAGGGSAAFHRWRAALPAEIGLVPACLSGREGRVGEPPTTELRTLVRQLADDLAPMLDRPWAVLGHSMGAWIAFELSRELRRRGGRLPQLLIVAASQAPDVDTSPSYLHTLPDDQFVDEVSRQFDGIPPAVRGHRELLELVLPALRADIQMVETYRYEVEPPLELEILALGGTDDPAVSATQLAQWRHHTSGKFSARLFPGGHFFLFRTPGTRESAQTNDSETLSPALRVVVQRLARCLDSAQELPQ